MKLNLVEFPSRMFTYNPSTKTLVCEASDMLDRHLQRLYDDAMDVGFAVKSDVTGNVIVYVMSNVRKNEGEVEGWDYEPSSESIRKYPECVGTKALIFND